MTMYSYRATHAGKGTVSGKVEALNKQGAIDALLQKGLTPLDLREVKARADWTAWFSREDTGLSAGDAGAFAQDLSRLLASGFSLHQALQMVAVSSESRRARDLAEQASGHVQKGGSLSQILSRQKGGPVQALAGLVQAGEAAGSLGDVLDDAAQSFAASSVFKERLKSALIYPLIILFMISLTLIIFFAFVLPNLQPLFDGVGDRLPGSTKALLAFGRFCEVGLPWILAIGLCIFVATLMFPKIKMGIKAWWHSILLGRAGMGAPLLAGYASYGRTLGLLLSTGVPLASANAVAAGAVGNISLASSLKDLTPRLREGQDLSIALAELGSAPDVFSRLVFLGERSGKLGAAVIDAAGILERTAQTRTDRLLSALTPALTIVLGLIVALVIGSLFLGIASLTDIEL